MRLHVWSASANVRSRGETEVFMVNLHKVTILCFSHLVNHFKTVPAKPGFWAHLYNYYYPVIVLRRKHGNHLNLNEFKQAATRQFILVQQKSPKVSLSWDNILEINQLRCYSSTCETELSSSCPMVSKGDTEGCLSRIVAAVFSLWLHIDNTTPSLGLDEISQPFFYSEKAIIVFVCLLLFSFLRFSLISSAEHKTPGDLKKYFFFLLILVDLPHSVYCC